MSFIDNIISAMEGVEDQDAVQYGVKGMRWGVSKPPGSGPGPASEIRVTPRSGHRKVKTSGGSKEIPASEDAVKAAVGRQTVKRSSTDALSNKELQAVVTRMQLEVNYKRLTNETKSPGRKFIERMIKNPNQRQALTSQFTESELAKQYKVGKQVGDAIKNTDLSTIGN